MTNLFISDELKQITIEGENWIKIPAELSVETIDRIVGEFKKVQTGENSEFTAMSKVISFIVKEWNFEKPLNFESITKLRFKKIKKR
jgi:hypothetical protein